MLWPTDWEASVSASSTTSPFIGASSPGNCCSLQNSEDSVWWGFVAVETNSLSKPLLKIKLMGELGHIDHGRVSWLKWNQAIRNVHVVPIINRNWFFSPKILLFILLSSHDCWELLSLTKVHLFYVSEWAQKVTQTSARLGSTKDTCRPQQPLLDWQRSDSPVGPLCGTWLQTLSHCLDTKEEVSTLGLEASSGILSWAQIDTQKVHILEVPCSKLLQENSSLQMRLRAQCRERPMACISMLHSKKRIWFHSNWNYFRISGENPIYGGFFLPTMHKEWLAKPVREAGCCRQWT